LSNKTNYLNRIQVTVVSNYNSLNQNVTKHPYSLLQELVGYRLTFGNLNISILFSVKNSNKTRLEDFIDRPLKN